MCTVICKIKGDVMKKLMGRLTLPSPGSANKPESRELRWI